MVSSPHLQFFQVVINVHHGELVLQVHAVVEVLTGVHHNVDEGHAASLSGVQYDGDVYVGGEGIIVHAQPFSELSQ